MRYRIARLLAGLNIPPVLGALLFFAYISLQQSSAPPTTAVPGAPIPEPMLPLYAFLEMVGFAYIFIGLQAAAFALLMEFLVLRLSNNVFVSLISGGIFGFLASVIFQSTIIALIGVAVGLLTSAAMVKIRMLERAKRLES